jgi:hypothetical protein
MTASLTTSPKGLGRHWVLVLAVALVALTFFGGLAQAGMLVPSFRANGGGEIGRPLYTDSYAVNLENTSWHSWVITGVDLAQARSSVVLPDKSVITIGRLYNGGLQFMGKKPVRPATLPLSVGPGQQITVSLDQRHRVTCRPKNFSINSLVQQDYYNIPVDVMFATPFGTRTVMATFSVEYGCPYV